MLQFKKGKNVPLEAWKLKSPNNYFDNNAVSW